ncbi:hypothetical protein CPC16_009290 [Podila verticillata]|nr:hypothetical protein BGZ59_010405 [Podila verticillata]KAF9382568.1 hypothetical protein CPC16_009290 [Podila verticillata]
MKPFIFKANVLRRVQNTIASLTITNILLMVASFSFLNGKSFTDAPSWASSRIILVMQVALDVGIILFWSLKSSLKPTRKWTFVSALFVVLLLLFSTMVFKGLVGGDAQLFLMWFVAGIHAFMAVLVVFEAFFAWHTDFSLPDYNAAYEASAQPTGVYLYQPRVVEIELTAPTEARVVESGPVSLRRLYLTRSSRNDELPRYQRHKPANAAVIIDMANQDGEVAAEDALHPSERLDWVPREATVDRSDATTNITPSPPSSIPTTEPPSYTP